MAETDVSDCAADAQTHYFALSGLAAFRERQLTPLLRPYLDVTDRYGFLLCRAVLCLGNVEPKTSQDIVLRDLMADVFDFLHEARYLILRGKTEIAYPLARRAFESLALMVACHHEPALAKRWSAGKEIQNSEVRKLLANHPMGEQETALQQAYKFFSLSTHPNRNMVAHRYLGKGNTFALGSSGVPNLVILAEYCIRTLSLWYWLGAFISWVFVESLSERDPSYHDAYLETAKEAESVSKWLAEQRDHVLAQEQARLKQTGRPW